mgnify:FL=1
MNLEEILINEHSKTTCDKIVHWVGNNQHRFDQLFSLFIGNDPLLAQRASWPLGYAAVANPCLIDKHFKELLENVKKKGVHNAIKRNTVRILQDISIPEDFQGDVMNLCFDYLMSPEEKPAIKAFSLTVLQNLSVQYPEILPELRTIIQDRWDFESKAFQSRARKILRL